MIKILLNVLLRKAKLTAVFFFLAILQVSAADPITVSGTVTDSQGQPIPGVSIRVKGTTQGVVGDADGKYTVNVADQNATLVFSYLNYTTKEVVVGTQKIINVSLTESTELLNEVVVVGYGTQKKVNLSGALNTVSTKSITNRPVTSLTNALQGAVPGMAVLARPGDVGADIGTINVRGRGNLGASSPLFVVDGVPVEGGDFARINPNDVESMSVLKDASASAIYGSRAAYGVILVTTKKGKEGKMAVNYNAYYGIQSALILPDWLGSYDYATLRNEAATNAGKSPVYSSAELDKILNQSDPDNFPDNNWYDLTLDKNAPIMEHSLNISGGGKTKYYISGSYFDQNSLNAGKNLKRYSIRSNTDSQISEKFKIGSNISFIRDNLKNDAGSTNFVSLNRVVPLLVNKQSNGEWGSMNGGKVDGTLAANNPLRMLEEGGRNSYNYSRLLTSVNGTYTPIKGLDINGMLSYNYYNTVSSAFINRMDPINNFLTGTPINSTGVPINQLDEKWYNSGKFLAQVTAGYEKTIGKHYGKILAGASYEDFDDKSIQVIRRNFVNNDLDAINAGSRDPLNTNSFGSINENAFQSVFGRFNYAYDDKYLFEASMRVDGSSQFATGKRWGAYPSFSGAWRLSQEDFMQSVSWVDELKVRASWGKLGNVSNVGNYDFYDGLNTGTAVILDQSKQDGVWPGRLANPTLSWEKVNMTNIGLDASIFNNKLSVQVDAFNRVTNGILLVNPSLPDEAGLVVSTDPAANTAPSVNLAQVQNRGVELSLTHSNTIGEFSYSIGGNFSKIWNKVSDLGGTGDQISGVYINRVGAPIGSFYMYEADGLFVDQAEVDNHAFQAVNTKPGDIKFKDLSGPDGSPDGIVDGFDRTITGTDVPYITYGLNLSANYKNFDLSVLGQGVADVDVYLTGEASQAFFNGAGVKRYALNRWTAENPDPNADYHRLLQSADNAQNMKGSSFWLYDADYFRIKSITLGYTLPKSVVEPWKVSNLRFYVSSNNLFTVRADKRMKDFDPEMASTRASYPQMKSFSFGVNLTF
ncbi:SusC/RagA family TonB-linked outer membrane protein [Pedobacter immunditicola]|uniref:SusC/RagA family TonB-linked outer membrane protein n=1 Tax=Pedobacter immunditicola TaxID=3133440 RepID=UPI0030A66830